MKDRQPVTDIPEKYHEVIAIAWSDEVSFDAIYAQTGLRESDVISAMRKYLKPSSFRMWRKRVTGRKSKHQKRQLHARQTNNS